MQRVLEKQEIVRIVNATQIRFTEVPASHILALGEFYSQWTPFYKDINDEGFKEQLYECAYYTGIEFAKIEGWFRHFDVSPRLRFDIEEYDSMRMIGVGFKPERQALFGFKYGAFETTLFKVINGNKHVRSNPKLWMGVLRQLSSSVDFQVECMFKVLKPFYIDVKLKENGLQLFMNATFGTPGLTYQTPTAEMLKIMGHLQQVHAETPAEKGDDDDD